MQHAFDVLGVVFGVLGLVGVVQIIYSVIHAQLPGQQFCELDEVMKETETLFMSSLEKGLIKDPQELRVQLQHLQLLTDELRAKVHSATTRRSQYWAMVRGLTGSIKRARTTAKKFRAAISLTTENERKQRDQVPGTPSAISLRHSQLGSMYLESNTPEGVSIRTNLSDITASRSPPPSKLQLTETSSGTTLGISQPVQEGVSSAVPTHSKPYCRSLLNESTSKLVTVVNSPFTELAELEADMPTKPHATVDPPTDPCTHALGPLTLSIPESRPVKLESPGSASFSGIGSGKHRAITQPPTPLNPSYEISSEVIHQVQLGLAALVTVIHALQTNLSKADRLRETGRPSFSIPSTPTASASGSCLNSHHPICRYHLSLQTSSFRTLAAQTVAATIPHFLPSTIAPHIPTLNLPAS